MKIRSTLLAAALLLTGVPAISAAGDDRRIASVTVSEQSGPAVYGTGVAVTYVVTVTRRSDYSGAFTASLSQTESLPSGAAASFLPKKLEFAAGTVSMTSTLTIITAGPNRPGVTTIKVKASSGDHSVKGPGTLSIDRAPLTVTANDDLKAYDARPYSHGNGVTYDGFVLGQTPAVLGGTLTFDSHGAINVGAYPLTPGGLSSSNYAITFVDGTLTIEPAVATVRANDKSKTYGAPNPALDATVTGAVAGGDPVLYSLATSATQFSSVAGGPYEITVTLGSNPNYSVKVLPGNGTLTIVPAIATVRANDKSKTYGDPNPPLDATVVGAVTGGDAIDFSLATTATQLGGVEGSPYPITVTLGANPNYSVTATHGALAIQRAAATVKANDKSKIYGADVPALDAIVTGAVTGGDPVSYSLATTATRLSGVAGSPYPITVTLGANPNYSITATGGALAVQPAAATVKANDKNKIYGVDVPALDAIVTGAVTGGDPVNYSLTTTATRLSGVAGNPYPITVSLGVNPNYSVTPTGGTLTVQAAAATVTANNKSKVYGANLPALDATVTGAVTGGDPIDFSLATTATPLSGVAGSPYPITVTLGANPNYSVTATGGGLTVQQAAATVVANDKSKMYGAMIPILNATVTGAVTGGDPIVFTLATPATQYSGVLGSPYAITVNLGANPNYSVTTTGGLLTVTPYPISVIANSKSKIYGTPNPTLDVTTSNPVPGGDPINYTLATTATQFSGVLGSPYPITITLGANPNYLVTPVGGLLAVQPAPATVKANDKSKLYGADVPSLDAAVTGAVTGGDAIQYTLATTASRFSAVLGGPYPITVTLGANPNYNVVATHGALAVQPAPATVRANNKSKTYGDVNPPLDATVTGEVPISDALFRQAAQDAVMGGGDPILYSLSTTATQFSSVPGGPYPIVVTLGANPNYSITATDGALTVQPAFATVKANFKKKTYGDPNPALDAEVTGQVPGGDPIVFTLGTDATQLSGVPGSPYAITVTLGSNPNYSVKVPADNGTLTIQPAPATVTANDKTKDYGQAIPILDAVVTGEVPGGDRVQFTVTTAATPLSGVPGSPYAITVTLGANPNYSVTTTDGALTVQPAFATVKANAKSKLYGDPNPALDAVVTGEVQGGDRVIYTLGTTAVPLSSVLGGPYEITVTLGSNPNYSVKVPADNGVLTVQPKPATVTANDKTKVYGQPLPALDAVVTGEVQGGDLVQYTVTTAATPLSGVPGNPYAITVTLGSNPNYSVTTTAGALTVQPAFATVKANPKSKLYGDQIPALDAVVTGEVPGGDRVVYTLGTAATPLSSVLGGPYEITVTLGSNPNYSVKVPADNGVLTVQPKPATVTANDKTKVYGAEIPELDATVIGEVTGGDRVNYTLATGATRLSGVPGSPYPIDVTPGSNPNYSVTTNSGALTVQPALAWVKANLKTRSYGAANPLLDATVIGEVPGGDRVIYTLSTVATPLSNVADGPYEILVTLGSNPNYSVKVPADNGTLTILPAPATVTANDKTKVYGDDLPEFDATVTGEVTGGDPIAYSLATAATPLSGVPGSPYVIDVTLGANPNYSVTATAGALTVNPAFAWVKANPKTRFYGAANPVFDATVTGEVQGGDRVVYQLSTAATPLSSVAGGPYEILVTLGSNPNYSVKVPADNGTLTIEPKPATVTANNETKVYGGALPALNAVVDGEVQGGDPINYGLSTTATPLSGVAGNPYPIVVTPGSNPNYDVSATNGALTVQPAPATVRANDKSKTYGAAVPALDATVIGAVTGGDPILYSLATAATSLSGVRGSPYAIVVTLGVNPNYSVVPTDGALTVLPAVASVRANDKSKVYGSAIPALDATVMGEVQGGDPINYTLTTTATPLSGVAGGPYPITVILGDNPNYAVTATGGALTVYPAKATVIVNDKSKIYGDPNPPLDATVTGEVTGADAMHYRGATVGAAGGGDPIHYTLATIATQCSDVSGSPYPIIVVLGINPNYIVNGTPGTLTIRPRPASVAANNKTRTYGDPNPVFDAIVTGEAVGCEPIHYSLSTDATPTSSVPGGPYAITVTLGVNPNYDVTATNGALALQTRPVTVAADARTKVYGSADPALTYRITSGDLVGGDAFTGALGRVPGESVAGAPYAILQGTLTLGDNYALSYQGSALAITAAPLTVTAHPQSKVYGDQDPPFTYAASGFQFADDGPGVLTGELSRAPGETVAGSPYAIGQGTLASNPNYTIQFTGDGLSVTRRPITVTAVPKTKKFGSPDPAFTYVITSGSLAFNDTFIGAPSREQGEGVHEGPYEIQQSTLALNPNYDLTFVSANLAILHAQAATLLAFTPDPQQYSDVVVFNVTVADGYANGTQALDAVTIRIGAHEMGTVTVAPSGSALVGTLSVALLEPELNGSVRLAPGTYPVTVVEGPQNDNFTIAPAGATTITIAPEDARATYTGASFVSTTEQDDSDRGAQLASSSSGSSRKATVTLSATIRDITATSDAAGDDSFGDIRNATVRFVDRGNGDAVIATVPLGLVTTGDTKTAAATYDWPVNIGSASSKQFTIGTIVDNYYARNSPADDIVVTVSKPVSNSVSGKGHLVLASSAGIRSGDAGTKCDFDFSLKYKSGGRLDGSIKSTLRSGGRLYQVKGSSMTSLAVQPASGTATFNGRVSVVDITDSNRPVTIDGDASLQVTMADLGEPGSSDLIAITVWNRNGGLWFASNWSGTGTDQQVLAGGDLQVKGNNGPPVARAALSNSALSGADPPEPSGRALPLQYAFPQNFPNPFSTSTSIRFDLPERSQVSLVVYDVMGRVVANLVDGPVDAGFHVTEWSGRSREGYPAAAGVYFVRMSAASLGGSGGLRSDRRIILVK